MIIINQCVHFLNNSIAVTRAYSRNWKAVFTSHYFLKKPNFRQLLQIISRVIPRLFHKYSNIDNKFN